MLLLNVKNTYRLLLLIIVAALGVTAVTPLAKADDQGRYLTLSLIGDSYIAGNGAGSYYGPEASLRSTKNWGHTYANWLNRQGVHTTIHNYASSGAVVRDVREKQLPALNPESDVVLLTIGGNDIKFADIVQNCFAALLASPSSCQRSITNARNQFPAVINDVKALLKEVEAKIRPGAEIILVGYPLLSIDSNYELTGWFSGRYPAAQEIRKFGQQATVTQQALVDEWNSQPNHTAGLTYVPVEVLFAGHEPDPRTSDRNPVRWVNEFFETEGVQEGDAATISKETSLFEVAHWYHPNITGHAKIGEYIATQVGIPQSVRTTRSYTRDVDVVFALENSALTASQLSDLKKQITRIATETELRAIEGGKEARFALLSYPNPVLQAPALQAKENLTQDLTELAPADTENAELALYNAINAGLDTAWKPGARKVLIVAGDAEVPADSQLDWEALAKKAYAVDVAEIFVIDIDAQTDQGLQNLALDTGGHVTLTRTIKPLIVENPTASISDLTVAAFGEEILLDASGSFGAEGPIVKYEWDLNNDGVFEAVSAAADTGVADPYHRVSFSTPLEQVVSVRVTDEYGKQATAETKLQVTRDGDLIADDVDNCPDTRNEDQSDVDGDGVGDACPELRKPVAVEVSSSTVEAGSEIIFTATGFVPNSEVQFTVFSTPVIAGIATANEAGVATLTWNVPADFVLGTHHVQASAAFERLTTQVPFEVVAAVVPEPPAPALNLPATETPDGGNTDASSSVKNQGSTVPVSPLANTGANISMTFVAFFGSCLLILLGALGLAENWRKTS